VPALAAIADAIVDGCLNPRKSGADGLTQSSFPAVVFGVGHANIPITPGMGAALGRLV
jgi:hypothetical protein